MPVRFVQGDIRRLLAYFHMTREHGCIYSAVGKDGKFRICKFDYHKDRDPVATGTANKIAKDLGFKDALEMKEFLRKL